MTATKIIPCTVVYTNQNQGTGDPAQIQLSMSWAFPGQKATLQTTVDGENYSDAGVFANGHTVTVSPIQGASWPRMVNPL